MKPRTRTSLAALCAAVAVAGGSILALTGPARSSGWGAEKPIKAPPPAYDAPKGDARDETAVLAGGCFWGMQGVFEHVRGVRTVVAGYAGGDRRSADYETVSSGTTNHAESVKIVFDPKQISFGRILQIYFSVATDPTQVNKQFPDEGRQYRGEIFYLGSEQKAVAERYVGQLEGAKVFRSRIATRIDPFSGFYPAEGYHQDYLTRHPDAPYIATYDLPKLTALRAMFPAFWRATPATS